MYLYILLIRWSGCGPEVPEVRTRIKVYLFPHICAFISLSTAMYLFLMFHTFPAKSQQNLPLHTTDIKVHHRRRIRSRLTISRVRRATNHRTYVPYNYIDAQQPRGDHYEMPDASSLHSLINMDHHHPRIKLLRRV